MLPRAGAGGAASTEMTPVAFDLLNAYDTAPYYAIEVTLNSNSGTFGGPKVNVDGQVISTEGNVIPGLYAAARLPTASCSTRNIPARAALPSSTLPWAGSLAGRQPRRRSGKWSHPIKQQGRTGKSGASFSFKAERGFP